MTFHPTNPTKISVAQIQTPSKIPKHHPNYESKNKTNCDQRNYSIWLSKKIFVARIWITLQKNTHLPGTHKHSNKDEWHNPQTKVFRAHRETPSTVFGTQRLRCGISRQVSFAHRDLNTKVHTVTVTNNNGTTRTLCHTRCNTRKWKPFTERPYSYVTPVPILPAGLLSLICVLILSLTLWLSPETFHKPSNLLW